ncbi:DUF4309 domain-containing protein [Shimazuella kribbensis]|uniref:DUF4309 domain-containing protein n=1 Tax=Shimazuella kribbensis TaxID=139808 RepID=UPI000404A778|nr:DUF4309 domain-containing protein [Shimazuella kribbensis]
MKKIAKTLLTTTLLAGVIIPITASIPNVYAASQHDSGKSSEHKQTLDQTRNLAAQGKVINSEHFGLGSKKKDILRKWGKPDSTESTGDEQEQITYEKRRVSFFVYKGIVTSVTTTDKRILALSHDEVEKAWGKPIKHDQGAGQVYETYKAGKNEIDIHWTNVTEKKDRLELVNLVVW